jgi:hypothetical protein
MHLSIRIVFWEEFLLVLHIHSISRNIHAFHGVALLRFGDVD